jgi:hypothetical protein
MRLCGPSIVFALFISYLHQLASDPAVCGIASAAKTQRWFWEGRRAFVRRSDGALRASSRKLSICCCVNAWHGSTKNAVGRGCVVNQGVKELQASAWTHRRSRSQPPRQSASGMVSLYLRSTRMICPSTPPGMMCQQR